MGNSLSGRHPHPEALYYAVADDALRAALGTQESFERAQAVATVIVFSALCLEAYANQELVDLGQQQAEALSLVNKWRQLPHFRGGAGRFDEEAEPFLSFKHLVMLRNNRLVHFHPGSETEAHGPSELRPYFGELMQDHATAQRCFAAVAAMIRKLEELAPGRGVPAFLNGSRYVSSVWSSVTVPWESGDPTEESGLASS